MKIPTTFAEAFDHFMRPVAARRFIQECRWKYGNPICVRCNYSVVAVIRTRGLLRCRRCRHQFSAGSGTIMDGSKVSYSKWILAIWMIVNSEKKVSSLALSRTLGLTQKTAYYMRRKIWLALYGKIPESTARKRIRQKPDGDPYQTRLRMDRIRPAFLRGEDVSHHFTTVASLKNFIRITTQFPLFINNFENPSGSKIRKNSESWASYMRWKSKLRNRFTMEEIQKWTLKTNSYAWKNLLCEVRQKTSRGAWELDLDDEFLEKIIIHKLGSERQRARACTELQRRKLAVYRKIKQAERHSNPDILLVDSGRFRSMDAKVRHDSSISFGDFFQSGGMSPDEELMWKEEQEERHLFEQFHRRNNEKEWKPEKFNIFR